jgi:indolepyruvate ferredoxin oxidoreductase
MKRRIGRAATTTFADLAGLAARQFGDAAGANMMALGTAWQKGRVPVSQAAIHRAIELNGAAVAMNKAAFAWGRALAADPEAVTRVLALPGENLAVDIDDIVTFRATELVKYQNDALALRYRDLVSRAAKAEQTIAPASTEFAQAVARSFFKLLAYKDEYEVARLHVASGFIEKLAADHRGGSLVFHMAPPLFARLDPRTGHARKVRLGAWMLPLLKILARLKFLRGTWADAFGATAERRAERRAIDEYERLIAERIIPGLAAHNRMLAVEIAGVPLAIRGYGHVKSEAASKAGLRQAELLGRWPGDPAVQIAAE